MNTVTIVLLLSMCYCALCGATPAVSSLDQGLVPSNEVATKLQRITRQTSPLNFFEKVASTLISVPTNLVADIINFILSIIKNVKTTFLSWIENIENSLSLINNNQNPNQRRRRSNVSNGLSDLISDLPNLLQLPISYFQQVTSSVGDSVGGQVGNIITTIAKLIWNFIRMRLLPWLRDVLNELKQSNVLPSFMNEAIGDADSLYSFLRLFANIASSSS
ncbi:uncharacterized protein LOC132911984 isoform X2 [Bombus pascuorum]|uniref:uncharacterized protein LOC132911984 isoform X2 n=1 Tax=Bombus pascuorum TaxID=65598 RepID=UPI0021227645|nr:uncharacterized protein LOC132911984 isoform X2 [Bombus pascuorum]